MASECIFLTDDLTPTEFSGPEKDRSVFSEGSRKCLRIGSKGFPQARLACSPSSPWHSEASEARFSLGSSPLGILGPGRLIYMYTYISVTWSEISFHHKQSIWRSLSVILRHFTESDTPIAGHVEGREFRREG